MLSRDGIIARYIFSLCFFLLSGSELITGWLGTISGVLGTIELATALLCYSPFNEIISHYQSKPDAVKNLISSKVK